MSVSAFVTINQTNCGCDGAITIYGYGGTPPYTYSINSGLTFKKMPFFTDLCSGVYFIIVKDDNDFTYTKSFTLNKPNDPITYLVTLSTFNQQIVNNSITQTKEYTTNIKITPSLPDNTYITFDLKHNNIGSVSPISSATTFTTTSSLTIGTGSTPVTYVTTGETTTNNVIPGCQDQIQTIITNVETWENLTYYEGDSFVLTTTSSSQKNGDYLCYNSSFQDTFTIENLKIFGCNCCSVTQ